MNINSHENMTFLSFVLSYVSLSVIAGLFTYRLLNSFLENILMPLLDISLLPDKKFHKLTIVYNNKKECIKHKNENNEYYYVFKPGVFLKEFIIWCALMIILYLIYNTMNNNNNNN